jgi:hypothetical protein
MNPKQNLPALTAQQTPVIAAAVRYRVLAAEPLREVLGAPSDEAVEKSLKRLKRRGWLFQLQLPARRSAYTLSREAVLTLDLSKKALKAMGRDAVVSNLAMLCYCARKKVERLTPDEVRSGIPELARPGLQVGNYFTDPSTNPPRLTWMLVDRGSSPPVLVRKAGAVVKKAYRIASMRELMQAQQFAIVVLVPNERKKWLVERILAKRFFAQVSVSVEVVPETQDLLLS